MSSRSTKWGSVLRWGPAMVAGLGLVACIEVSPPAPLEVHDAVVVDGNCAAPTAFYRDADGDGQGSAAAAVLACEAPAGFVDNDLDCADLDPDVHSGLPEESERCFDGVDNNCDGRGCAVDGPLSLSRTGTLLAGRVAGEQLGRALASPADADGDGQLDLLFGVESAQNEAAVYLLAAPLRQTLRAMADDERIADTQARLPATTDVRLADVTGDRIADVLVARTAIDGAVRILAGPVDATSTSSFTRELPGGNVEDVHRIAVADLDDDGALDLVVGAPEDSDGRGLARIYYNQGGGEFSPAASADLVGADPGDQAGFALAGPCDVDGDGVDDVIVGSPSAAGGAGAAFIVRGQSGMRLPTLNLRGLPRIVGASAGDRLGQAVACGGALRGDGVSEVLVGAPGVQSGAGAVFVIAAGVDGDIPVSLTSPGAIGEPGWGLGTAVLGDFDHDGDGRPDIAAAAAGGGGEPGRVLVFHSPAPPFDTALATPSVVFVAARAGDGTGASLAAGDLDRDGRDELLIGVPNHSDLAAAAGAVRIVAGGLF